MPERLSELQRQFAAHIRNPSSEPAPSDVEGRRMEIYRNLFFNNVRSLLAWNFPVIRKLYSDENWSQLVREFYVEHQARTPLFPELPREFLQYLQEQRGEHTEDIVLGRLSRGIRVPETLQYSKGTLWAVLDEGWHYIENPDESEELYDVSARLSVEEETLLRGQLPELESFPTPRDFATLYDDLARLEKTRIQTGEEFWQHDDQDPQELPEFLQQLKAAVAPLQREEEWVFDCLEAGRLGGERRESWLELARLIEESGEEIGQREALVLEHGPEVDPETTPVVAIHTCTAIIRHLDPGNTSLGDHYQELEAALLGSEFTAATIEELEHKLQPRPFSDLEAFLQS